MNNCGASNGLLIIIIVILVIVFLPGIVLGGAVVAVAGIPVIIVAWIAFGIIEKSKEQRKRDQELPKDIRLSKIAKAKEHIQKGEYSEAIKISNDLNVTDKREVFDSCHSEDGLRIIKDIKLGKQCIFGISKRGFETEAFWNIVDKKGDCVLLVSDSPLYTDMAFDYSKGKLYKTWKDTDLRKWINKCYDPGCTVEYCARTGQRYDTDGKQSIVFSKTEKKLIMETELDTNGEKTVDKFFLLSEDEYKKYRELLGDSFYGWLRSYRKGEDLKISHGCVERFSKKYSEEINYKPAYDEKHGYNKYGVYPAVWIDLSNL